MRKKKTSVSTILLVIVFLVGLSVMLYPKVSNWYNSTLQGHAIADYSKKISQLDDDTEQRIIERARDYNAKLSKVANPFKNYDKVAGYDEILDITGTGIMGYVTIPQIGVELPIYHGTSKGVLNIAVGHFQGSSLPVGGTNTHAVISAHRGLPSARLFTDLDKLAEGDQIMVTVLKEVYTYEVEKIFIVNPWETEYLGIIPGGDYLTLTTCTPYGINTHRLLVRARRVNDSEPAEGEEPEIKVLADAVRIDSLSVIPYIAAPIVLLLLIYWLFGTGGGKVSFDHEDPLALLGYRESGEKDDEDNYSKRH